MEDKNVTEMRDRISMVVVGLVFGQNIVEDQLLGGGSGHDSIHLVGVCDLNQELGARLASKHNLKQYGTSRKKLTLGRQLRSDRHSRRDAHFCRDGKNGSYQWENFRLAVANGGVVPGEISAEQIAAGVQVISAMVQAEKTGKRIEINEEDYV